MDIMIGIAGALVGGRIMNLLGFSAEGGLIYTILACGNRRRCGADADFPGGHPVSSVTISF